jgi:hypothetical protein
LMAGYAKAPALARSSMRAYTSGVAIGMSAPLAARVGRYLPSRAASGPYSATPP